MNSLLNYGSDDDIDDSPDEKSMDSYGASGRNYRKPPTSQQPDDTNYDEVQMSLSEDSDAESRSPSRYGRDRDDSKRSSPKYRDSKETTRDRREDRSDKERYDSRDRNDDRSRYRDDDRTKSRDDRDSRSRDDERSRDKHREREDDRLKDRRDDRRAKSRERYSNRDDRSKQDRDRRRSRSPRDSRDKRRSRSPRRSRSRERVGRGGFSRRFDRRNNRLDKNDPKSNSLEGQQSNDPQNKDRFFMPGITGRFRDQIEKRKLLWQKKDDEAPATSSARVPVPLPSAPKATKVWEGTTFAQDTDGKVANKFKRLMGIKTPNEGNKAGSEVLKKQDEMFSAMEQQYEVARTTTHTMRGVGLGFGSYNR